MLSTGYIELKDANAYVAEHHRHVAIFSLVCYENGRLCGIATVDRPRAVVCPKHLHDIILNRREDVNCRMS